jgi:hypothetical protein
MNRPQQVSPRHMFSQQRIHQQEGTQRQERIQRQERFQQPRNSYSKRPNFDRPLFSANMPRHYQSQSGMSKSFYQF